MLCLWHIPNADDYLMKFTMVQDNPYSLWYDLIISLYSIFQMIVRQLQALLDGLSGSPVGLKLNVELNNFFLASFRYHVELWATFLSKEIQFENSLQFNWLYTDLTHSYHRSIDKISLCTANRHGMFGSIISIVDISRFAQCHHAPLPLHLCICFDVSMRNVCTMMWAVHLCYYSSLYRIEIDSLIGFWRIVSGRRRNVIKGKLFQLKFNWFWLLHNTIISNKLSLFDR